MTVALVPTISSSLPSLPSFHPPQQTSPFFIFGCPRSGTSLLSTMLGSHPNLAIPYESHLYNVIYPAVGHYINLDHPRTRALLVAEILKTEHIRRWTPAPSLTKSLEAITRHDFHGIVDGLLRAWALSQGKSRWGEKTPQHTLCWRTILPEFERVQVIHIIRDGRDVALSYRKAFFGPKHVHALACRWQQYLAAAEETRAFMGDKDFLQVRYEDLLATPEQELRRICAFLGEEFSPVMLAYYQGYNTLRCDQRNAENLRRPVMSDNAGKWRTNLTERELRIFEALAGASLERYGYARALDRPRISGWESLSCRYLEHPPLRAYAVLKNSQAWRLALQKLRLRLSLLKATSLISTLPYAPPR
jgi:Sulfotransferase family